MTAASDAAAPPVRECAAYPRAVRWLAGLTLAGLVVAMASAFDQLLQAPWSRSGLALFALAWLCIGLLGYWIMRSRTQLDGATLTQSWLWRKVATADEVAQMRLVHWPLFAWIVAPRLFVRLRNGAMLWFQASDASLLGAFAEQVAARHVERLRGG